MVETTTTTLTLRLDRTLKADLDRLAGETHRSKSYLAAQAIKDFVADELQIIDGIKPVSYTHLTLPTKRIV